MEWNTFALWRGLHVFSVVLWIGGVAFVTLVLLPALRKNGGDYALFDQLERRFATQARITTQLALISGIAMLKITGGWERLVGNWWLWAMVLTWAIFTLMLFVLEPLLLHKVLLRKAKNDPAGTMNLLQRLHWVLLTISLITVVGGAVGAHGGIYIG